MTRSTWLRIATGFAVLLTIGHTVGAVLMQPAADSADARLFTAMTEVPITDGVLVRNYLDAYRGSGWTITAMLAMSALLLLQLSRLRGDAAEQTRAPLLALGFGFAGVAVVGAIHFVLPPIIFSAAVAVCCLAASRARTA